MIYLIQAGPLGPVKIGHGVDLAERLRCLQTGNHEVLHLLRSIEGGKDEETWLHERFRSLHLRAEWFTFHHDMLADFEPEMRAALLDPAYVRGRGSFIHLSLSARISKAQFVRHAVSRPASAAQGSLTHAEIIQSLGGPSQLARDLGLADKVALHWGQRGIPARHWAQVANLPKAAELAITTHRLAETREAMGKPTSRQVAA